MDYMDYRDECDTGEMTEVQRKRWEEAKQAFRPVLPGNHGTPMVMGTGGDINNSINSFKELWISEKI